MDLERDIQVYERELIAKERELEDWNEKINIKSDIIKKRSHSQKAEYRANGRDPIDLAVGDIVNRNEFTVPVQRLGPGEYIFGTRNFKIEEGYHHGDFQAVTRMGDRMRLEDFFLRYHDEEKLKLDHLKSGEEIVVDHNDNADYQPSNRGSPRGSEYSGSGGLDR